MEAESDKDTNQTTIKISNYYNLWADHKRNKFEKIIFEKKINEILPFKMLIFLMEGFLCLKKISFFFS